MTLGKELRKEYEKGASVRDLATAIGRSYTFVHRLLKRAGTKMRTRGGHNAVQRVADAQADRKALGPLLKARYNKGKSGPTLAAETGKSRHFVYRALHEQGTVMRNPGSV